MGLNRADKRVIGAVIAAIAAMTMCFAAKSTSPAPLQPLPWAPPEASQPAGEGLVDVNAAGLEELMTLPGIGPARAQAILDDRAANGPYRYPEDLVRVRGIGEGILSGILDQITTGSDSHAQNTGG